MKAYAIVMTDHKVSETGFAKLKASSESVKNEFEIERFEATIPDQVDEQMKLYKLDWNWPWSGHVNDKQSGIRKHAYATRNPKRRMACALSHFRLWKKCVEMNEPILILEHDAKFIQKFEYQYVLDSPYQVIGINDPRGATRLAQKFHDIVQKSKTEVLDVPTIDRMEVAQGIAGASAYIIKPSGCQKIVEAAYEYGLWPNDALICQQLFNFIGVTKKYYTKIQGLTSTTSSIQ